MNLKQVHKLCMPFIKLKKDGAREVGPQALDWKLPFGEMALHHHFRSGVFVTMIRHAEMEAKAHDDCISSITMFEAMSF